MDEISHLIEQLRSSDKRVRYDACEDLRVSSNLPMLAIKALEKATHDPDPVVADAAKRAFTLHSPSRDAPDSGIPDSAPESTPTTAHKQRSTAVVAFISGLIVWVCFGATMLAQGAIGAGNYLNSGIAYAVVLLWVILGIVGAAFGVLAIRRKDPRRRLAVVGLVMNLLCIVPLLVIFVAAYVTANFLSPTSATPSVPATAAPVEAASSAAALATHQTTATTSNSGQLSSTMLTLTDIDTVVPGVWHDYQVSSDMAIKADLCRLDCFQRGWESQDGLLVVELIRLENAAVTERSLQTAMATAKSLSYVPQYLPRVDYLPDHTWLGILQDKDNTVYYLLMQHDVYYIRMWLFAHPQSQQQITDTTNITFRIAGKQWGKLFASGFLGNISTPPPAPAGYTYVTEQTLSVSVARPNGWQRDTGIKPLPSGRADVQYVLYYNVGTSSIQSISIFTINQPLDPLTPQTLIEQVLAENQATAVTEGFKKLEDFNDLTVANQITYAMAYRITDPKGIALYSIILPLKRTDGKGLVFQWTSSEALASTTRASFLAMVPTISFVQK